MFKQVLQLLLIFMLFCCVCLNLDFYAFELQFVDFTERQSANITFPPNIRITVREYNITAKYTYNSPRI